MLDVYDYSDNMISSAIETVKFVNQAPVVTNFIVTQIVQTATDYVIDTEITATFTSYQNIDAISCNFQNPSPVWQSYLASGGTAVIPSQVVVSKTNPAGTYTLYAHVRDDFANISAAASLPIILDDLALWVRSQWTLLKKNWNTTISQLLCQFTFYHNRRRKYNSFQL